MKSSGNTVLITGGGSGIGLELARQLDGLDNQVIICGRRREPLRLAAASLPKTTCRACDVSKPRSRDALMNWLEARKLRPNILINNAGVQRPVDFLKGSKGMTHVDEQVVTNLLAPMHLSAALIPILRRKKSAAIVNISSGLAFTPKAQVAVYSASKAALHSWTVSLRHQLRDTSVRVFEMVLPLVDTKLHVGRYRPTGPQVITARQAAEEVLEAIESDTYEAAFGTAVGAMAKREALFPVINQ